MVDPGPISIIEMKPLSNPAYSGSHEAPTKDGGGAPLYDVSSIYPEDIYSYNGARYYGHYGDFRDNEAIGIIQRARNKPDHLIRIYRAVPKSVKVINPGDWVTTVRSYAKEHGESALNGDYRILSKVVHNRDLFTSGDSPFEWGYDPQEFNKLIRLSKIRSNPMSPKIPTELESILEDGDQILNYDRAEGEEFYDLYDLVYTTRRPTNGEIQEVAGLLHDNGVFAVMSGESRDLEKYFKTVGMVGKIAVAQGPKNPEESRINAEKRRNK